VEVTGTATTSCLKIIKINVLSNVTYSSSHRQVHHPMLNIQSQLRTAPDLAKMFHPQYYLVAKVLHIQSLPQPDTRACVCVCVCERECVSVYIYILLTIKRRWWGKRS